MSVPKTSAALVAATDARAAITDLIELTLAPVTHSICDLINTPVSLGNLFSARAMGRIIERLLAGLFQLIEIAA